MFVVNGPLSHMTFFCFIAYVTEARSGGQSAKEDSAASSGEKGGNEGRRASHSIDMGKWTIVCGCAQEGRGILIRCVGEVGYIHLHYFSKPKERNWH
jgi:hypothetical protein